MLAPHAALAGSYSVGTCTGGAFYGNGTNLCPYVYSPQGYGHGVGGHALSVHPSATGSDSGQISAPVSWTADPNIPNDQLPQCAIVSQWCDAYWNGTVANGGTCTGTCDNGLGAPAVPYTGRLGAESVCTSYSVQNSPGTNFTVNCSPTASFSISASGTRATATGNALLWYSATVTPVTIQLSGATLDSSGNYDILVGQQCTASLQGIPSDLLNNTTNPPVYSWTVSGDTFKSLTPSTPSVEVDAFPLNQSTATWYFKDVGPGTANDRVTCTATFTPPAGQGSPITITITQIVNVCTPDFSMADASGGEMRVDANCPNQTGISLYAGPTSGQAGGMNWRLKVTTPQTSVAFGSGSIELIQLITTGQSFYTSASPPVKYNSMDNGLTGLDTESPYQGSTASGVTATVGDSDSPFMGLDSMISQASMASSFIDYLLYQPPAATGSVSTYVPIAQVTWGTSGTAMIASPYDWSTFSINGSPVVGTVNPPSEQFTANSAFPNWTNVCKGTDAYVPQP